MILPFTTEQVLIAGIVGSGLIVIFDGSPVKVADLATVSSRESFAGIGQRGKQR